MISKLNDLIGDRFDKFVDHCDRFIADLNPKIERFEHELRGEFQRISKLLPEWPRPLSSLSFFKIQDQLSPPQASIQVGKTSLKVNGSFQNARQFLQKLFDYEVQQSQEKTDGSHKHLAETLIHTMEILDEACSITQLIEGFANDIQHFRNNLSLDEQDAETAAKQARLACMLENLQRLAVPSQLNSEIIEKYSKQTRETIGAMRTEFDALRGAAPISVLKEIEEAVAVEAQEKFQLQRENIRILTENVNTIAQNRD